MKARTWITIGAVATASFVVAACGKGGKGKDGTDGNNAGGAGSVSDQLEDLRAEIDELRAALENASEDQIPELLAQLEAAEARLAELENCQNGGNCEGVESALALTALTDAYCEWVFSCCTDDEVRATIGAAAGDEDGCKAMYSGLLARGNATPVMPSSPGGMTFDPESLSWAADGLQKGRIALDADNIDACAELTASMACGDADPVAPAACGEGGEASTCGAMFRGLQGESEPCRSPLECEAGLVCTSSNVGLVEGVCLVQAVVDDPCQSETDCTNVDGDLYCDEGDGTCKVRPGEGDDCEFADPTFNFTAPSVLTVPCLPGLFCSPESKTCVAACEALENGDLCTDHDQCGDARYCDFAAEPNRNFAGNCATKLAQEATCSDCATECASGVGSGVCAGIGGNPCDTGGECASGSCTVAGSCRAACDYPSDCGSTETCVSGVCYEDVTSNSACLVDEQCPAAQFCGDSANCTNKLADGAATACGRDEQCRAGSVCAAIDARCRPATGSNTGAVCSDWFHCSSGRCDQQVDECLAAGTLLAAGATCNMDGLDESNINVDPCGAGLFCKRNAPNSTSNFAGVCAAQVEPGNACNRSLAPAVNQCAGNTACATNSVTGVHGCRVPYAVPDTQDRCVLNPQTFRVETAYGNSGTGGPGEQL